MGPRKQPPHHVEVKAAEQNVSKLHHEVYLPNDTNKVSVRPQQGAGHVLTFPACSSLTALDLQCNGPHCQGSRLCHDMFASILQASVREHCPELRGPRHELRFQAEEGREKKAEGWAARLSPRACGPLETSVVSSSHGSLAQSLPWRLGEAEGTGRR